MKFFVAVTLTLIMTVTLIGCGGDRSISDTTGASRDDRTDALVQETAQNPRSASRSDREAYGDRHDRARIAVQPAVQPEPVVATETPAPAPTAPVVAAEPVSSETPATESIPAIAAPPVQAPVAATTATAKETETPVKRRKKMTKDEIFESKYQRTPKVTEEATSQ